jgi:RNA polymerase subunit RPABC4/transcription elongation factor Spt4
MKKSKEPKEKERKRVCPYCEEEILMAEFPYCRPCGIVLRYCARCHIAVVREAEVCPQCGGELEWQ